MTLPSLFELGFGLFLMLAAWRAYRTNPRNGVIVLVVLATYAALVGRRYVHQLEAGRELAQLIPERVARVELDGQLISRPEDAAAVIQCLRDASWFPLRSRALSRAAALVVTLSDGTVWRYDVQRSLRDAGARIHFLRQSGYAFSPTLPQVLSRAGAPLP
jgi:hypothetical protein